MRRTYWVLALAAAMACADEKPGDGTGMRDSVGAGPAVDTAGAAKADSTVPPADTVMARDTATQL